MRATCLPFVAASLSLSLGVVVACSATETTAAATDGDAGSMDASIVDPAVDARPDGDSNDGGAPPTYDFTITCATEPCVQQIAGRGGAHACAVMSDGTVRCWGANDSGQLGTGRTSDRQIPAFAVSPEQVPGLSNATGVAVAGRGLSGTTCVVHGASEVACFGSNAWGQLGRDVEPSEAPNPDPVAIDGLRAKAVTLANTFALATGTDDRLWSWGTNDTSQLARATSESEAAPSGVPARADRIPASVRSVAGTSNNGFFVGQDGELLSWGAGTIEQLGRTISSTIDPVPRAIALDRVSSVATGAEHVCALASGAVYCWGHNAHGQLGTGTQADELFPARTLLPNGVYAVAVAAGGDNTCIIASEGDVYCWGANESGQLGIDGVRERAMPSRISGLADRAIELAVMDESVCALLRSGLFACWGDNLVGQLGRGTRDPNIHLEPGAVVFK